MRETSKRESGGQSLEIDGENGWDVCFEKVVLSKKKSLASVWSPASEGKGVQEGDVDVQDVTLVWRDHPACLCVFSRHRELHNKGPVFGSRPGRSSQTHTGRPNRTFFAATGPNVRELRVINGRFQAKSQDDSLFPISQVSASSTWARDSETLLTPDCAAAARAGASNHKLSTRSCRHQSTIYRTVTSGFPLPCHSGSLSSSTSDRGNRMGIPPIWID